MTEPFDLAGFAHDFADALKRVDARSPQALSKRSGRAYQPGIGPHSEQDAVRLVVDDLRAQSPQKYPNLTIGVQYPNSREVCDLCVGAPAEWAIEVKMARPVGDNGKLDDTWLKDILSPYKQDRSAVSDCAKLAASGFMCRKGILIYGFDYGPRPLDTIVEAFETLARRNVAMGPRQEASFTGLVHPVHCAGRVFAWEVFRPNS